MNRLLLADLKRMWRQGLAISILLGCGIALFVMTNSSMVSLQKARRQYYSEYRFGDVFASLVRAPNDLANRVAEVEGVQRVQRRIVRNVLLYIPTMAEPASCLLVSIDTSDPFPMNAIHLTRGRFPVGEDRSETIVIELFAEAHGLRPGDSLDCIMGGRKQRLRIVGIGLSPEFVYVAQPGLMITDNRRYGVVWMPRRQMEAAFNMEGAFNNLSIALQPRANTAAVIASIDRLTRPYGGTGAYDREDQIYHHRVADEMSQQQTMAFVMPTIFFAVSAFLFNIVFTRLVNQQTEQIATLRAFGYRPTEIGWHYIKMVLFWVLLGSALGWSVGLRLSWWMTSVLGSFFQDTIDYVTDLQFNKAQRQDVMLTFVETMSANAAHDVAHLPGVTRVEPSAFLKVSALGVEEKRVNIIADFVDPIEDRQTLGDGFRTEAKIVVDETPKDSLKIPAGALFRQADTWHAFRVVDGVSEQVDVQVGRSNGIETEVLGGIDPKDTLILHPTEKIRAGTKVMPAR